MIIAIVIIVTSVTGIIVIINQTKANQLQFEEKLKAMGFEEGDQIVTCENGSLEIIKPNSTIVCGQIYSIPPQPELDYSLEIS